MLSLLSLILGIVIGILLSFFALKIGNRYEKEISRATSAPLFPKQAVIIKAKRKDPVDEFITDETV